MIVPPLVKTSKTRPFGENINLEGCLGFRLNDWMDFLTKAVQKDNQ
jgi:hypothetical protein